MGCENTRSIARLPLRRRRRRRKAETARHTLAGEISFTRYRPPTMRDARLRKRLWSPGPPDYRARSTQNPHRSARNSAQVLGIGEQHDAGNSPRMGAVSATNPQLPRGSTWSPLLPGRLERRSKELDEAARSHCWSGSGSYVQTAFEARLHSHREDRRPEETAPWPSRRRWAQAAVGAQAFRRRAHPARPYKINDYDVRGRPVARTRPPGTEPRLRQRSPRALLMERVDDLVGPAAGASTGRGSAAQPDLHRRRCRTGRHQAHRWRRLSRRVGGGTSSRRLPRAARTRRMSEPGSSVRCGHRVRSSPGGRDLAGSWSGGARHGTVRIAGPAGQRWLTGVTSPGTGQ